MHYNGLIGHRDIINRLVDESLTKPHGNYTHDWIYCEPRTGKPHGDTPTICTNIVVRWLRENAHKCKFIIYFPPGCGIGGQFYSEAVHDDRDFIEPHKTILERRQHNKLVLGKEEQYLNYIRYLLKEFPNLYILPYHSYIGEGSIIIDELRRTFPNKIIDPSIFEKAEKLKAKKVEAVVVQFVKNDPDFVKRIKQEVSHVITQNHRDTFHGSLRLEFLPKHTEVSGITFSETDILACSCFDHNYFQMALRHYISLRMLGQYCGKCFAILSGSDKWEQWQLDVLKKLHVDFVIDSETLSRPYILARFIVLKEQLRKHYPNFQGPMVYFDTDIWFQQNMGFLLNKIRGQVCFGMWHGQSILEKKQFEKYREKYFKVLSKSIPPDRGGSWLTPAGGIPHGGCHGGPCQELLKRYDEIEKYLRQGLLKNARSEDEVGLFLSCDPDKDYFLLSEYWTLYPSEIDLVTRKIKDNQGIVRPILHFENTQKVSSLADFFIIYPDVLSRAIEAYNLIELTELGRLTAWHLRSI